MASQKVIFAFVAIFCASVLGKPFTIDVLETKDLIFPREGELVKRTADEQANNDVSELSIQKISLSSLIDNIENGLLQTALSAGSVANNPNAQIPTITAPHSVSKRSTDEEDRSLSGGTSPVVLVQTTENVLGDAVVPAHVVIDRVSIFKAPVSGEVLFPTFHLQETIVSGETGEVIAEVEEDRYVVSGTAAPSNSSEESSESSEESDESSEEKSSTSTSTTTTGAPLSTSSVPSALSSAPAALSSAPPALSSAPAALSSAPSALSSAPSVLSSAQDLSSTAAPSSSTTPSSTTKSSLSSSSSSSLSTTILTPVSEKNEEKVADYEAEPVILTARL